MKFASVFVTSLVILLGFGLVESGPVAGGLCYTACNAGYVTCMTNAGLVAGVAAGPVGLTGAALGCSLIQGACMGACTPIWAAPTP
jgi:hypothetical protein